MGFLIPNNQRNLFNEIMTQQRTGNMEQGYRPAVPYSCFVYITANNNDGTYTGSVQTYTTAWANINDSTITCIEINGEQLDVNRRYKADRVGGGIFVVYYGGVCQELVQSFDPTTCTVTNIWAKLPPTYSDSSDCYEGEVEEGSDSSSESLMLPDIYELKNNPDWVRG